MYKKIIVLLVLVSYTSIANATVILPPVLSDHMVLQQNSEVTLWGWANPTEEVTIAPSWTTETYTFTTDGTASWKINIKTPKAGGPYTITFTGYNTITLNDVYLGEVWFCSGQSNMEMSAGWGIKDGDKAMAEAHYPEIRFLHVPKITAEAPQNSAPVQWEVCTPESMKSNSAVAYYYARKLQEKLNVPVGVIISAWGGSPAQIFIPDSVIQSDKDIKKEAATKKMDKYSPVQPGIAYNAMTYPFLNYKIAGFLWYQGESNVGDVYYHKTLGALINTWRNAWNNTELPFYLVQIAPYNYGNDAFNGGAIIRNSQRLVTEQVPNTDMVVISDVSTTDDIHPKDKQPVGERLAHIALARHYQKDMGLVNSPAFVNFEVHGKKATLTFNYAEGLHFTNKEQLFEIAGADGTFYKAKAKIKNDKVILTAKQVKKPVNVRFAWGNTLQSNLFNNAGLPASTFTTEN